MIVRFHRLASRELRLAVAWYRERDLDAARRFQEEVENAVSQIRSRPESQPMESGSFFRTRVQRFPYRLVFEWIDSETIQVLALIHDRRRPGYWRDRK